MSDFSKIDVFALGVFLVNMLTLDYAFENAIDDNASYLKFLDNPRDFFKSHNVKFYSDEELSDICELLQNMLEFDLEKRISITEVQKMRYVSGTKVPRKTTNQIREIMEDRQKIDETLMHLDESFHELKGVPVYVPFSWNCTTIRHTFQKGSSMEIILD